MYSGYSGFSVYPLSAVTSAGNSQNESGTMSQAPEQPRALVRVKNREKNRGFTAVHSMVWTVSQAAATLDRAAAVCV